MNELINPKGSRKEDHPQDRFQFEDPNELQIWYDSTLKLAPIHYSKEVNTDSMLETPENYLDEAMADADRIVIEVRERMDTLRKEAASRRSTGGSSFYLANQY
mgnify:CR=1 FL=1